MIIDPDFLDHWRTVMVSDSLGDPMAPIYIMRLWGHCQDRKSDTFEMPPRGLKAQCKFPGDADAFESALIEAGFIERSGGSIHVVGWMEKNASLVAAWSNGSKGGRPRKKPIDNRQETHGFSTGNPTETHGQPIENPDETDKRREEKRHTPDGVCDRATISPTAPEAASTSRSSRGRRLPEDWVLPRDWGVWALETYPQWTSEKVRLEADRFRDHWRAASGRDAAKLDWLATWRNWCRNPLAHRDDTRPGGQPTPRGRGMTDAELAAANAVADAEAHRRLFGGQETIDA